MNGTGQHGTQKRGLLHLDFLLVQQPLLLGQIRETNSDLHRSNKCAALVSLRNMNVLVLRYTLDNQELANLSLSRTSQALGSKLL